jgi:hypothetical protein
MGIRAGHPSVGITSRTKIRSAAYNIVRHGLEDAGISKAAIDAACVFWAENQLFSRQCFLNEEHLRLIRCSHEGQ